ncbi:MAG: hypothetical protein AABM29_10980 [Actinomycetota bacterium]
MPDLSLTVLLLLLAWVLLSVSLGFVFFVIPSWRRSGPGGELYEHPRIGRGDRRTASRDRRVGLPDTRAVRTERRRGASERRREPIAMA